MEETGTALAILPAASLPTILAADENDIFGKLFAELDGFTGDASTERGRKEIASKANKVSIAKQDLLRLGKGLKEEHLRIQKSIIAEEKIITERFDTLRTQVRRPLDEREARLKAIEDAHKAALAVLESPDPGATTSEAQSLEAMLGMIRATFEGRDWEDFAHRARAAYNATKTRLETALSAARQAEADAIEFERLRAENAERQRLADIEAQRLREEQIARDAAEAARIEAETKAEAGRQEAERLAQVERDRLAAESVRQAEALERAERQKAEAEERERRLIEQREASRVRKHGDALAEVRELAGPASPPLSMDEISARKRRLTALSIRDWEEFDGEAAEARAIAGIELDRQFDEQVLAQRAKAEAAQAESERVAAERQRQAEEAAIETERQRVADEAAAQKAEDDRRAADKAHRGKINREAMTAIYDVLLANSPPDGTSEPLARAVVEAIVKGAVPHISIRY